MIGFWQSVQGVPSTSLTQLLLQVTLSISHDGYLHFNDVVCLYNPANEAMLSANMSESKMHEAKNLLGPCGVSASKMLQPCVRNAFMILRWGHLVVRARSNMLGKSVRNEQHCAALQHRFKTAVQQRNAAKLQHLCSCLAVEVMLQHAAILLCSAYSSVHQFAAILHHHSFALKWLPFGCNALLKNCPSHHQISVLFRKLQYIPYQKKCTCRIFSHAHLTPLAIFKLCCFCSPSYWPSRCSNWTLTAPKIKRREKSWVMASLSISALCQALGER